jgi:histidyl-tRNA synthetase
MDSFFTQIGIKSQQSYVLKKAIDKKAKLTSLDFEKLLLEEICLTQEQLRSLNALFDNPQIYLDQPYASELKDLLTLIEKNGIKEYVQFDPSIMRGLDYYTGNVFEQFDLNPENTRAMYGGGRYDDLVKLFTGDNLTGIGFGMGDVTLLNFLESWKLVPQLSNTIDYLVTVWPQTGFFGVSTNIASLIRELGYSTQVWLEETTALEKQLKYGVKANVANIILIGPNEIENNTVTIKELASSQQKTIPLADFLQSIKKVS